MRARTPKEVMLEVAHRAATTMGVLSTYRPGQGYLRGTTDEEKAILADLLAEDVEDARPHPVQGLERPERGRDRR